MLRTLLLGTLLGLPVAFGQPAGFEASKAQALRLLETNKPLEALTLAKKLNQQMPDDLDIYAVLVDAHRALGNTREAVAAAQWMLNLRPTDVRGLLRSATLRADADDLHGALDLLNECYHRTPAVETASRASILTHIAGILKRQSKLKDASLVLAEAERLRAAAVPDKAKEED